MGGLLQRGRSSKTLIFCQLSWSSTQKGLNLSGLGQFHFANDLDGLDSSKKDGLVLQSFLSWSSRCKSLLLTELSRATMFSKWSGPTERVGLLQRAWSGTTIFFCFSWSFRRKNFLLSHYQTQEWNGVSEGVQTLSSKGWMAARRQYMGTCLGILAAVALVGTLTHLYTQKI